MLTCSLAELSIDFFAKPAMNVRETFARLPNCVFQGNRQTASAVLGSGNDKSTFNFQYRGDRVQQIDYRISVDTEQSDAKILEMKMRIEKFLGQRGLIKSETKDKGTIHIWMTNELITRMVISHGVIKLTTSSRSNEVLAH